MAAPVHVQAAMCGGKVVHKSYARARKCLRRILKRGNGGSLEVYRCLVCSLWHLGGRRPGDVRRRIREPLVVCGDDE